MYFPLKRYNLGWTSCQSRSEEETSWRWTGFIAAFKISIYPNLSNTNSDSKQRFYPLVIWYTVCYWKWPSRNSGFTHFFRMVDLSIVMLVITRGYLSTLVIQGDPRWSKVQVHAQQHRNCSRSWGHGCGSWSKSFILENSKKVFHISNRIFEWLFHVFW